MSDIIIKGNESIREEDRRYYLVKYGDRETAELHWGFQRFVQPDGFYLDPILFTSYQVVNIEFNYS